MTTPQIIEFFVPGLPKPSGSKRAFHNPKTGGIILTDDCRTSKDWRADVKHFAFRAYQGEMLTCPLLVTVTFVMPRPKSHYRTGRYADKLRDDAPLLHVKTPDRTKLFRGLEDALTGVVWKDDRQVQHGPVVGIYGKQTGALVRIEELDPQQFVPGMLMPAEYAGMEAR